MTRILSALFIFLFTLTAAAQIQPQYMRQSKSAQIQIFTTAQTSSPNEDVSYDGSVIETTSFNSAQVFVDFAPDCFGRIYVLSSLNKSGPFLEITSVPNSYQTTATIFSVPSIYNVTNFGPFIKFRFEATLCTSGINISTVLVPFPSNVLVQGDVSNNDFPVLMGGSYGNDGVLAFQASPIFNSLYVRPSAYGGSQPASPVSVTTSPTTLLPYLDTRDVVTVILQNQGTFPVRCGYNDLTSSAYSFSLKAGAVAGDGSGGSVQFLVSVGPVKCVGIGGTSPVSINIY